MTRIFAILALSLLALICHVSSVSALQPVCTLASSARPARFAAGTSSFTSSVGSYAQYAETAFTTFINNMYNFNSRFLLAQQGQTATSNYWNTALAIQGLLQYGSFHAAHGIPGQGYGQDAVINTVKGHRGHPTNPIGRERQQPARQLQR